MTARLHICPLDSLELERVATAAGADLDHDLVGPPIYGDWHTILRRQLVLDDHRRAALGVSQVPAATLLYVLPCGVFC